MKHSWGIAFLCLLLASCAHKRRVPVPVTPAIGAAEFGIASWYGYPYHGRAAASGEVYDQEQFTAAHRTLPFGTWVRVRNLANGKAVEVRINDRGPFVDGRIVDLSRAAARAIGLIGPGITQVRLEVIAAPAALERSLELYAVQVGAFKDRRYASRVREDMERRYGTAALVRRPAKPELWRVLVGQERTMDDANALLLRILNDSEAPASQAFVVRLDESPSNGQY